MSNRGRTEVGLRLMILLECSSWLGKYDPYPKTTKTTRQTQTQRGSYYAARVSISSTSLTDVLLIIKYCSQPW